MLLVVKARAHWSALVALAASILVASLGFTMPFDLAGLSAVRGAIYGLVICWVILGAIWFYQVTVLAGRFEDLRRTFDRLGGGDLRIQAILIAFCFGGLLEALAGFGAPVAITATMILALGVKPLKAAITVLLANTAPVAFGAVAVPDCDCRRRWRQRPARYCNYRRSPGTVPGNVRARHSALHPRRHEGC